jgi:hypothetical protein
MLGDVRGTIRVMNQESFNCEVPWVLKKPHTESQLHTKVSCIPALSHRRSCSSSIEQVNTGDHLKYPGHFASHTL